TAPSSSINAIFRNVMIFGTNTFSAIDNNNDNIVDQFSITFQVLVGNNNTNVIINNINVWLIFQYELRARQYINMETMAFYDYNYLKNE
ncbi:unnamed protein product, partial [Rotaria sordida]